MADAGHQAVVALGFQHQRSGAHGQRQLSRKLQRLGAGPGQRREHPGGVAIETALRSLEPCRLLAAHGMPAHRLYPRRQLLHGGADLGLGAAHVHDQRTRPELRPDLGQGGDDGAHRRGQNDDVGPQHAGLEVVGGQVHGMGEESIQHRLGAPGHPAHFPAEPARLQIQAEACPHEAEADNGDGAVA